MLDVALKEWAVVTQLLAEGELAFVLRKGGIHEVGGPGVFELEHERFALYPAWMHQQPQMLKPAYRDRVQSFGSEPEQVTLNAVARATHIWPVPSRQALDELDELHPWSPGQLDMRWNYKPQRPLYVVALRVSVLDEPRTLENDLEYAGCRSWVPLKPHDAVDDARARSVLDEAAYERLIERLAAVLREA